MTRFQLLETLTQLLTFHCFLLFFSREIFPFSACFLLRVHIGLNFQTSMYEHTKVLLLTKCNTRTPGKYMPWDPGDVDTFGVLGTTLTKVCYVKLLFQLLTGKKTAQKSVRQGKIWESVKSSNCRKLRIGLQKMSKLTSLDF